jgi:hypothetical protein
MSAETPDADVDLGLGPGACKNAEQYALKRLEQADEPLRPAQMADEYDCTPGHMRDALLELRNDRKVERVGRGEYALTGGDHAGFEADENGDGDSSETDADSPTSDTETDGSGDEAVAPDDDGVIERPSVDGGLPSLDIGIQDGDRDESKDDVDELDDGQDGEEIVETVEETSETGMPSIPVELVIVVAVAMFVFWWLFLSTGSDSEEEEESEDLEDMIGDGSGLI